MFKERAMIVDRIEVTVRDKDGNIKKQHIINNGILHRILVKLHLKHNSITSAGMAVVAGLILTDVGGTAFDYIAIGKGTTPAAVGDDTTYNHSCQSEVSRKAATGTRTITTYTNDTAQLLVSFSSADGLTGTDSITEVIVVNNASAGSGTMLLRQVYSPADPCDWDQGDTIQVTVKIQVKQGT